MHALQVACLDEVVNISLESAEGLLGLGEAKLGEVVVVGLGELAAQLGLHPVGEHGEELGKLHLAEGQLELGVLGEEGAGVAKVEGALDAADAGGLHADVGDGREDHGVAVLVAPPAEYRLQLGGAGERTVAVVDAVVDQKVVPLGEHQDHPVGVERHTLDQLPFPLQHLHVLPLVLRHALWPGGGQVGLQQQHGAGDPGDALDARAHHGRQGRRRDHGAELGALVAVAGEPGELGCGWR